MPRKDPKHKLTGKEPSPKGLGYCAHDEPEGLVLRGRDKNYWQVKKDRIGRLAWRRVGTLIVTQSGCHYCTKAKELLDRQHIEFVVLDLSTPGGLETKKRNKYTTVPRIWIKGTYIGTYTDAETHFSASTKNIDTYDAVKHLSASKKNSVKCRDGVCKVR